MDNVGFFLILAYFAWLGFRNIRRGMRGDDFSIMPRIEEEFRALRVDHELPERCFDGRNAEIVEDRQEAPYDSGSGTVTLHRVHRFACNAHGEYFHFISEGVGTPYFQHIKQENAKLALGKKYRAPPSAAR